MDEINEIDSIITIKNRLANKFEGSFRLFRADDDNIESELIVKQSSGADMRSTISVKVERNHDINASVNIMYRSNSDIEGSIEAVASNYMESLIEVRPHNRFMGSFNLMSAPVVTKVLHPIADATTRSRSDLRTINYGDTRSMLIGRNTDEEFSSFLQFGNIDTAIPDLKFIQSAKLRLYYSSFASGNHIELHQPNTIWRELGVTDANKPFPIELLAGEYTINTVQRYIEFDFIEITKRWQNKELENFGLMLSTEDNNRYTFYTRESDYSPELIIEYITSQVYSIGRSELEGGLFVYGARDSDISARLTVDSDVGLNYLDSSLYVHRYEDPMFSEQPSIIASSRPDLPVNLTVQRRENAELESYLTVAQSQMVELNGILGISSPEVDSLLTIDPNMSLESLITVAIPTEATLDSLISVSIPDMTARLSVSEYTRANEYLDASLTVRTEFEDLIESAISISNRDLSGLIHIRAVDETEISSVITVPDVDDLDGFLGKTIPYIDALITARAIGKVEVESKIEVPHYDSLSATIGASSPDMHGHLMVARSGGKSELESIISVWEREDYESLVNINNPDRPGFIFVKHQNNLDTYLYIKDRAYLDSLIDIKNISEMSGVMMVKAVNQIDSEISINNPELFGVISPRVVGENELLGGMLIKKRNVGDMNSYITIRGKGNRNLIIIF